MGPDPQARTGSEFRRISAKLVQRHREGDDRTGLLIRISPRSHIAEAAGALVNGLNGAANLWSIVALSQLTRVRVRSARQGPTPPQLLTLHGRVRSVAGCGVGIAPQSASLFLIRGVIPRG